MTPLSAEMLDELGSLLLRSTGVDHVVWLDLEQGQLVILDATPDDPDRYVRVPVGDESGRLGILEGFMETLTDTALQVQVRDAIWGAMFGPGAFRRVKDVLDENGAMDLWYAYDAKIKRGTARRWLMRRGVAFTEEVPDG